jgi:hypothetical protein
MKLKYIYICGATCAPHAEKKKKNEGPSGPSQMNRSNKKKEKEERTFRVQTREIGRKKVRKDFCRKSLIYENLTV